MRDLSDEFFKLADKDFVSYNRAVIDDIKKAYSVRLRSLKESIYTGKDLAACRIDRHKVVALYIQLCLEKKVFKLPPTIDTRLGASTETKLINEMYCLRLAKNALEEWNGKKFNVRKFKKEYMSSFLKLLWHYKDKAEFQKHKDFFTYALAHVVYFLERNFVA
jgi:hypothetical protein